MKHRKMPRSYRRSKPRLHIPFGYQKKQGRITLDPREATVVRQAIAEYARGHATCRRIAQNLARSKHLRPAKRVCDHAVAETERDFEATRSG